jgi:hypothetical protein
MQFNPKRFGYLAFTAQGEFLELEVLKSAAGFYIGTSTPKGVPNMPEGAPNTRESNQYWPKKPDAVRALQTGKWPQKLQL